MVARNQATQATQAIWTKVEAQSTVSESGSKSPSKVDVSYRKIAKMLASGIPEGLGDYSERVQTYLEQIRKLSIEQKVALRSAYIFCHKVPREEREDFFQTIALTLFTHQTSDEKLGYAVARCDWLDFWKKFYIKSHLSLDTCISDSEGNETTLAEMLVGETEFERKACDRLDAQRIWDALPSHIKPLVLARLLGQSLNHQERNVLNYWAKTKGATLLLAE